MKKCSLILSFCAFLLLSFSTFAGKEPVELTLLPTIIGQVEPNSTNTYNYNITNYVNKTLPLRVVGLNNLVTLQSSSCGTCGQGSHQGDICMPNLSTCTLAISIDPTNAQAGQYIYQELEFHHYGRGPKRAAIEFNVSSLPVYVAVGIDGTTQLPVIAATDQPNGSNFNVVPLQDNKLSEGVLNAVTCTGKGGTGSPPHALCVAVGNEPLESLEHLSASPLILVSHKVNQQWESPHYRKAQGLKLTKVQCVGEGPLAFCVAIGTQSGPIPTIPSVNAYTSHDSGKNWREIRIGSVDSVNGFVDSLNDISCSGSENDISGSDEKKGNSICAIVSANAVYLSRDNGIRWETVATHILDELTSVSCIGGRKTGTCVIGSTFGPRTLSLTAGKASISGPVTLHKPNQPLISRSYVSCTGVPGNSFCIYGGTSDVTRLFYSRDTVHWTPALIALVPPIPQGAEINNIACTGGGTYPVCIAVGSDNLLLVASDGTSWANTTSSNSVTWTGAACQGTNSAGSPPPVRCLASGYSGDPTFGAPIVYFSNQVGEASGPNWQDITPTPVGNYLAVATTR